MFLDNSLAFQSGGWTTPQTVTTTADGTQIVDITGAGSGNAPAMINGFPATNTAIGADYGAGDGVAIPYLYFTVNTTGANNANTSVITVSAAPDDGSYGQGSYTVLYTSRTFTNNTDFIAGKYFLVPLPPTFFAMGEALPRFYKITYTNSATLGSAKFFAGLVLNPQESGLLGKYNNNFLVV